MSYIVFKNINKYYEKHHILKDFNLSINRGSFVTLLGPSGCGKSTLLRCLAGLESIQGGNIFLDGEDITLKNSSQRNVGMIFQQYSLFPTMNVYNNIAFGLKMNKFPKEIIHDKVSEALKMVNLKGSEKKFPSQLSGGEQQRVALARCIVTEPKVLLLDEPFSAIDAKLRKSLQKRIKEIHRELNITSIFVTHDQDEAMTMSDIIHVMDNGIIEQSGTPTSIYSKPETPFVAGFIGNYNLIPSNIFSDLTQKQYSSKMIAIRPEAIKIFSSENEILNNDTLYLSGVVLDVVPQGNTIRYFIGVDSLIIKIDTLFNPNDILSINQKIYFCICEDDILMY